MKDISSKVLIDPSLVLAENSVLRTLESVRKFTYVEPRLEYYYPHSLRKLVDKREWYEKRWAPKYFLGNANPSHPEQVYRFIRETEAVASTFQVKAEHREKHAEFYDSLRGTAQPLLDTFDEGMETFDKDVEPFGKGRKSFNEDWETFEEDIINILFEEWVFLQEHSWIVSRIKKPFTRFMAAGGVCLQFGRRATDLILRRSLHRQGDELLTKVDILCAFGKWIAVGGPSILGIMADPLFSLLSVPGGFFMLFDPDPQPAGKDLL